MFYFWNFPLNKTMADWVSETIKSIRGNKYNCVNEAEDAILLRYELSLMWSTAQ